MGPALDHAGSRTPAGRACARTAGALPARGRYPGRALRPTGGKTDWPTLLTLHRLLHAIAPSLGCGVALAATTAEVEGPAAGLATLDTLLNEAGQRASRFQPALATRAHLLDQLGRSDEAVDAYDTAIGLTHDVAERQYLQHRRDRAMARGLTRAGGLCGYRAGVREQHHPRITDPFVEPG